jgi:phage terminase large subunit
LNAKTKKTVNFTPAHPKFDALYCPFPYKIFYGGRAGIKSWELARASVFYCREYGSRILYCREIQNSIKESSYKLIKDTIYRLGIEDEFYFKNDSIEHRGTGGHYFFKGLWNNEDSLKSTEGVDICIVEEAQSISWTSYEYLDPTIRKAGAELWASMNPFSSDEPFYVNFISGIDVRREDPVKMPAPKNSFVTKTSWRDNPWFIGSRLFDQMVRMRKYDYDNYLHIWEGEPRTNSSASILGDKVEIRDFTSPEWGVTEYFYGVDWGFSTDPTCLIRSFEYDDCLYIDHEAYRNRVETNELPALLMQVPRACDSIISADNARPEHVSYCRRNGLRRMVSCRKWSGSIEDGISHLRSYKKIYIHNRCKNTIKDFKGYSFAVDKKTSIVTNKILDLNNHAVDAVRYSLERKIMARSNKITYMGAIS